MNTLNEPDITRHESPHYGENATAIYGNDYAAAYESLYIEPWREKHKLNARNLAAVLRNLKTPRPVWLDLACGQAWHFSMFPGQASMVGVDLSQAQLARARARVPQAAFIHGDMARVAFPAASIDLITNFWAAYCYLGSEERIASMLKNAVSWIRPGGALYIEVLLGRDLESFNRSRFAGRTGFTVKPRSEDYTQWGYEDVGGWHEMTSPPLEFFLDLLSPGFEQIQATHDSAFMVHFIATGRKRP